MKDLEIAKKVKLQYIGDIAKKLGVSENDIEMYGKYKAKLPLSLIDTEKVGQSNLILVSAISPTPAGEGKTTTSIGLSEGLNKLGKKTTVVLNAQTQPLDLLKQMPDIKPKKSNQTQK